MKAAHIAILFLCIWGSKVLACENTPTEFGIPTEVKSCQSEFRKMYDRLDVFQSNLSNKELDLIAKLSSYLEKGADREIECTVLLTGWLPGELWKEQPSSFIMLEGDFNRYLKVADLDVPQSFKDMLFETASTNLASLKNFFES
ncbi:hypothetical protein [Marinobacter arenosus]|uniref:hypothetical protein n=1 Tax=Marinobacter arenosus TaxID=2856822 RepID=UPI001C4B80B1|nr:hypothetical protein [Marinobacter arenosus]MBW0145878.1 hypothetical protein [Marinobacter arenosus]